jgi:hypothetical protein
MLVQPVYTIQGERWHNGKLRQPDTGEPRRCLQWLWPFSTKISSFDYTEYIQRFPVCNPWKIELD